MYDYNSGFEITDDKINRALFDWQRSCVKWSVKKGRSALFQDCGLGKTYQQIEWLRVTLSHIGGSGLIVCPLSVSEQTIGEGDKLGVKITPVKSLAEINDTGIYITNYEQLHHFEDHKFTAIVLDESSILKSVGGKTKELIFDIFRNVKYKLSCTATPSPNDVSELGNQVEFLGIMSRAEMLAKFFINDAQAGHWRLKGHAHNEFYKWMSSWAIFIRKPSDIGYPDDGYELPELNIQPVYVDANFTPNGELFPTTDIKGIQGRHEVRRKTYQDKVNSCARMIESSGDQWIVWCELNDESTGSSKSCI